MRCLVAPAAFFIALLPLSATAQQGDDWYITLAPMYLSAAKTDGHLTAGSKTVPVFMDFKDTASNLSAAFSVHFEGGKGRWGVASDLNYMGLSTESTFTVLQATVEGEFDYNQTVFELAGTYRASAKRNFGLIGGLRTFTVGPKVSFTRNQTREVIDTSQTSANFFAGFTYRPRLSDKLSLLTRADIGGGDAHMTWSATVGGEYRFKPWGGVVVAYKGLGIDSGEEATAETIGTGFHMTYYGPTFGLNLHWGKQ
jgi:hypothetical protein